MPDAALPDHGVVGVIGLDIGLAPSNRGFGSWSLTISRFSLAGNPGKVSWITVWRSGGGRCCRWVSRRVWPRVSDAPGALSRPCSAVA